MNGNVTVNVISYFVHVYVILFKNRLKLLPPLLPVTQKSLASQLLSNRSNQGEASLLRWCSCEFGLSLLFGKLKRKFQISTMSPHDLLEQLLKKMSSPQD